MCALALCDWLNSHKEPAVCHCPHFTGEETEAQTVTGMPQVGADWGLGWVRPAFVSHALTESEPQEDRSPQGTRAFSKGVHVVVKD